MLRKCLGLRKAALAYSRTSRLGYTQEQIFNVVQEVDNYKHFLPYCRESKVVGVVPDTAVKDVRGERPTKQYFADLEIGVMLFSAAYRSMVSVFSPRRVHAELAPSGQGSAILRSLSTDWRFAQGRRGLTEVEFQVQLVPEANSQTKVVEGLWGKITQEMPRAFEQRLLSLYGPPTAPTQLISESHTS